MVFEFGDLSAQFVDSLVAISLDVLHAASVSEALRVFPLHVQEPLSIQLRPFLELARHQLRLFQRCLQIKDFLTLLLQLKLHTGHLALQLVDAFFLHHRLLVQFLDSSLKSDCPAIVVSGRLFVHSCLLIEVFDVALKFEYFGVVG